MRVALYQPPLGTASHPRSYNKAHDWGVSTQSREFAMTTKADPVGSRDHAGDSHVRFHDHRLSPIVLLQILGIVKGKLHVQV